MQIAVIGAGKIGGTLARKWGATNAAGAWHSNCSRSELSRPALRRHKANRLRNRGGSHVFTRTPRGTAEWLNFGSLRLNLALERDVQHLVHVIDERELD